VIHYKGESTVKDGAYMKRFQEAMNFFYKKHFKVSVFFSLFMKIGIIFFSFVKMFQGKSKPKKTPETYIFISNDEVIKEILVQKHQKKVTRKSSENGKIVFSQTISNGEKEEIILDLNHMSFKETISFLEENKSNSFTFKVLPPESHFIIGSNSNNDRGEVINL